MFYFPSDLQHAETRSKPSPGEKEQSEDESDAQQHGRLSALEQLQYKLTTQVLQTAEHNLLDLVIFLLQCCYQRDH